MLATAGKKFPLGRKSSVDGAKIMELIDQLRVAIPQDVTEAEEIIKKREDLLNQSLIEARRIRTSAETEFRTRVEDTELLKEAHKQSAKVIEDAEEKAKRILDVTDSDASSRRDSADQYAQEVLYKLEQEVADVLTTIRNGIDAIATRHGASKILD